MAAAKRKSKNIVDSIGRRSLINPQERDHLQRVHLPNNMADTDRLYLRELKGHYGCVNSLSFSSGSQEYLASGGDDRRVLLWPMAAVTDHSKTPSPAVLKTTHHSNIFTVSFSSDNSFIYSAGNDGLLLTHDLHRGEIVQTYQHEGPVYCISAHPLTPRVITVATDSGSVFLIDTRAPKIGQEMIVEDSIHAFCSVAFNPLDPHLVATGNEYEGASLFDLRKWKRVLTYKSSSDFCLPWLKNDVMSVDFNSSGSKLCVLQKGQPPKLFNTLQCKPELVYTDDMEAYKNSVTMKTTCFAGDQDEYVVTGSDDFRVYWWKTYASEEYTHESGQRPYLVIPGHKSIVNQVRYSPVHHMLVSSGVEKSIKIWTQYPLHPDHTPCMSRDPPARDHYSYGDLISMSWNEDIEREFSDSSENMEENGRALALFDQLIREENGHGDSSSMESDDDNSFMFPFNHMMRVLSNLNNDEEDIVDAGRESSAMYQRYSIDSFDDDDSDDGAMSCPENLECTCPLRFSGFMELLQQDYPHDSVNQGSAPPLGTVQESNKCSFNTSSNDNGGLESAPGQSNIQSVGCSSDSTMAHFSCTNSSSSTDTNSNLCTASIHGNTIVTTTPTHNHCHHYHHHNNNRGRLRHAHHPASGGPSTSSDEYNESVMALRRYFTKNTNSSSRSGTENTVTDTASGINTGSITCTSNGITTNTDSLDTSRDPICTGTDFHDTGTDPHCTDADSLNTGTEPLCTGTDSLDTGTDSLDTGTDSLGTGTDPLCTGTDSYDTGIDPSYGVTNIDCNTNDALKYLSSPDCSSSTSSPRQAD